MGTELGGLLAGTGAKMKGDIGEDSVVFRGAYKGEVPFEEITAEARGTLLVLMFRGNTVELGAGARAAQFAAKIRSPPSRVQRLGVEVGSSAALAGAFDPAFRGELEAIAVVPPGVPKDPVDALFWSPADVAALVAATKLAPLVAATGTLWVVFAPAGVPNETQIAAAAKPLGLKPGGTVRFAADKVALRLRRA